MAGYRGQSGAPKGRGKGGFSGKGRGKGNAGKGTVDTPELAFFAKMKDDSEEYGYATIGVVKRWPDTGHLVLDINLAVAEKYVNENGYVDNVKLFEYTPSA